MSRKIFMFIFGISAIVITLVTLTTENYQKSDRRNNYYTVKSKQLPYYNLIKDSSEYNMVDLKINRLNMTEFVFYGYTKEVFKNRYNNLIDNRDPEASTWNQK